MVNIAVQDEDSIDRKDEKDKKENEVNGDLYSARCLSTRHNPRHPTTRCQGTGIEFATQNATLFY